VQIDNKVRLLFVITKLELGGAQKQALELIKGLDKDKFSPILYTAKEGILVKEALEISGLELRLSSFLERSINPIKDFFALLELCIFVKSKKIDILHTHSSKAGILGRLAGRLCRVKVILHTVHGWSFNDFQPLIKKKIFVWFERFCSSFTDVLIVVSEFDKAKGIALGIGREDKYRIVRYGIDQSVFKKNSGSELKRSLGVFPQDVLVGTVCCFKPQKAPQDFVKVAYLISRQHPNVKFILAGDGESRPEVEKLIQEYGLKNKVILVGWRNDIAEIMSALDIFVLTSLWEGLPVSVLEAMSCSKPVVATDTGGIREVIIDGKTGYLAEPHDVNGISDKLRDLVKSENLRNSIGEFARISLRGRFSYADGVKAHEELFMGLVSRKQNVKTPD